MGLKSWIRRHAVGMYFALAFLVAWGGAFAAVGPKFMRGEALRFEDALLAFLPMLVGPSLAGGLMAYVADGKSGLRALLAAMRLWRVPARWYAPVLIFPVLILATQLSLVAFRSADFAPSIFPAGVAIGLLAGFFEEIGWTGFALPRMQVKYGALAAAVLLGALHSLWHLMADYLGASGARGAYWLPHFAMFLAGMTAVRVLIVWVYANTRSVLLAQLMHASSTGFLSILVPLSLSPRNDTLLYSAYAAALWAAVVVVVARNGPDMIRASRSSAGTS